MKIFSLQIIAVIVLVGCAVDVSENEKALRDYINHTLPLKVETENLHGRMVKSAGELSVYAVISNSEFSASLDDTLQERGFNRLSEKVAAESIMKQVFEAYDADVSFRLEDLVLYQLVDNADSLEITLAFDLVNRRIGFAAFDF